MGPFSEGHGIGFCIRAVGSTLHIGTKTPPNFVASGVGAWLHVTPLLVSMKALFASLFWKALRAASYHPSGSLKSRVPSKQCNLILECWVKSALEFDHNGFVIIILCKVYELLESVNVVVNRVLALVPAGAFEFGEGH